MSERILSHINIRHGIHHPLLAIDFENDTHTGEMICAGVYGKIGNPKKHRKGAEKNETDISRYFENQNDLFDFLLSLKANSCRLIFYNLSYDKVYLNGILDKPRIDKRTGTLKSPVLRVGNRIITIRLKNGLRGLDLFNHTMNGSLEDWSKWLNMPLEKQSLSDHERRVMTDAEMTYRLGTFIEDFYFYECGIPLKLTVGSAALSLFLTRFFNKVWVRDDDTLALFEREAYYGGRVETFRRGELHNYSYDINSTYLSIMRDCPIPNPTRYKKYSGGTHFIDVFGADCTKNMGIIKCRVKAPEGLYIGVLPVRIDGKLKFPIGEFIGTWCSIELAEAIKNGYKLLAVEFFVVYNECMKYFSEFAKFVWRKRLAFRKASNVGADSMIKRVGNSFYGKFGERNEAQIECKLSELDVELSGEYEIREYLGEPYVFWHSEKKPSPHEFPVISAFITAYARIKLLRGMQANHDNLIYCDTDSIKLLDKARCIQEGDNLGEWKFEGETVCHFYRSKFYGDKHKGVPKRARIVAQNSESITFQYEKPLREREAMKRNLVPNVWTQVIKILLFEDDKRDWVVNESTAPVVFYQGGTNILLSKYERERDERYADKIKPFFDNESDYPEYDSQARYDKQDALRERANEAKRYGRDLRNF